MKFTEIERESEREEGKVGKGRERRNTAKLLLLRASRESRWIAGTTVRSRVLGNEATGVRRNSLALYSELTKQFAFQKRETITHA